MGNRFKEVEEEVNQQEENSNMTSSAKQGNSNSSPKKGGLAKSISTVFGGNFLSNPNIVKLIPFIFFLSILGLSYIANGYWADDKIRQLNKLNNELKELRTEHVYVQSELESSTNENYVAEKAKKIGLVESRIPPKKIVIKDSFNLTGNGK